MVELRLVRHLYSSQSHFSAQIEEFVAAGDFLAYKFPVWNWSVTHSICYLFILRQGKGRHF